MLKDKVKALIAKNSGGDNKKKIENLAVFVVILVVTLIVINLIWNGEKKQTKEPASDPNKKLATSLEKTVTTAALNAQDDLSMQLEDILGKVEGVGKVKVLITYSQTSQTVPLYNEDTSQKDTQETDTNRRN